MTHWLQASIAVAVLTVAGFISVACWTASRALQSWGDAGEHMNASLGQLDTALAKINQPGTGTLAELGKTAVKIGDIAVTAQIQVRQTGTLIAETSRTLDSAAADMHTTSLVLTGTAQAATDAIGESKRTIAAAQPLLAAYTQSGNDLDMVIKDKSIHATIDNTARLTDALAGATFNMESVTGDMKRVGDDLTDRYFHPAPKHWYSYVVPVLDLAWKAAMVAK
jgi:hypothetical protein